MKIKILIIGCNGFIGSHCAYSFSLNESYHVYGCDINKKSHLSNYFEVDFKNPDYTYIFKTIRPDICLNCSGYTKVQNGFSNPIEDFRINTINVFNILNNIRIYCPRCKFLNISSAAIYGDKRYLPLKENFKPSPISPYGFHKLMSEIICKEFYKIWKIPTLSIRVFSPYGPGLKKQLLWDIVNKLKVSDSIELFGTGNETRDFIYISDLTNTIKLICEKTVFKGQVMNIGNGNQIEINKIVHMLQYELRSNADIKFNGEYRPGDPKKWEANIDKIKKIGYKKNIELLIGIKNYVKWLNENGLL